MISAELAQRRPVVAVIGAGFSGVMTALHLLTDPQRPFVLLFEQRGPFARGAAYSTPNPDHVLNVRASNMSAWPEAPQHFTDWLSARRGAASSGDLFASRGEYGRYLQEMLSERLAAEETRGRLTLAPDEVARLEPNGDAWRLTTAVGRSYEVDAVVLAVGAGAPVDPGPVSPALRHSPLYGADPWRWRMPDDLDEARPVLILGAGLTMVDMALSLSAQRRDLNLIVLSRRGLWPLSHQPPSPSSVQNAPGAGSRPLALLRWLRRAAEEAGWAAAVDSLRPVTQNIWTAWSPADKARFLRHARPYWDIHRHRLAPTSAARIAALRQSGQLTLRAGRLLGGELVDGGVLVRFRPRGERNEAVLHAASVLNCTGLSSPLKSESGLLSALAAQGLIRSDSLSLGLDADAQGRLIGGDGAPVPGLYGIGPSIRGALWEIVAVPDIRNQAPRVARSAASHAAARAALKASSR